MSVNPPYPRQGHAWRPPLRPAPPTSRPVSRRRQHPSRTPPPPPSCRLGKRVLGGLRHHSQAGCPAWRQWTADRCKSV
eukprot:3326304-Prymnesium_polylepis.4